MRVFPFLLLLLLSVFCYAQDKDLETIRFAVTCGAGAQTSPEIETFKQLNDQKDYPTISRKLFAENAMEQVLSAILLKHYSSTGAIELSKQEQGKIEHMAKSKKQFFLCFTCTFSEKGTLQQLFSGMKDTTYELIKGTMLNSF